MRLRTILSIMMFATLTGCDPDPQSTRIDARMASPSRHIDAVSAIDLSGGATVAQVDSVYLVAPGAFPRLADRVFAKERACFVRIRWLDASTLEVSFAARDGSFQPGRSASAPEIKVRVKWRGRDLKSGC